MVIRIPIYNVLKPAALFPTNHRIYLMLAELITIILRHATIRFFVRMTIFSKQSAACLKFILRNDQFTISLIAQSII